MADGEIQLIEPEKRFADCNSDFKGARYIFFGVPFDATVSHGSGASKAPDAIREETYNFETYLMDLDVDLEDIPMADIGDLDLQNEEEQQIRMIEDTRSLMSFLLSEGKFPLMMGGEHSVTEGAVDAFMEHHHNKGGTVVIVDAHLDFRNEYLGNPHSHACVARRMIEKWGRDRVVMIGIRSGSKEEVMDADRMDINYVTSEQVRQEGIHPVVEAWDGALSIKDRPVYLSIDIDGIDPAFAPGTGTPEPWGLNSIDVLHLLQELRNNIIAMDVVEVSPDIEGFITPGLAGKLLRQMVGLKEMVIKNPTWLEKI
jgi:agmatinase